MIRQLFYVSRAASGLDRRDVEEILTISRWKNARRDVTGCLLSAGGVFAQVLEGDAGVVTGLAATIARDDRHDEVRTVLERDVPVRAYGAWSMAFVYDLSLEDGLGRLLLGRSPDVDPAELMARIHPDTVVGGL